MYGKATDFYMLFLCPALLLNLLVLTIQIQKLHVVDCQLLFLYELATGIRVTYSAFYDDHLVLCHKNEQNTQPIIIRKKHITTFNGRVHDGEWVLENSLLMTSRMPW